MQKIIVSNAALARRPHALSSARTVAIGKWLCLFGLLVAVEACESPTSGQAGAATKVSGVSQADQVPNLITEDAFTPSGVTEPSTDCPEDGETPCSYKEQALDWWVWYAWREHMTIAMVQVKEVSRKLVTDDMGTDYYVEVPQLTLAVDVQHKFLDSSAGLAGSKVPQTFEVKAALPGCYPWHDKKSGLEVGRDVLPDRCYENLLTVPMWEGGQFVTFWTSNETLQSFVNPGPAMVLPVSNDGASVIQANSKGEHATSIDTLDTLVVTLKH